MQPEQRIGPNEQKIQGDSANRQARNTPGALSFLLAGACDCDCEVQRIFFLNPASFFPCVQYPADSNVRTAAPIITLKGVDISSFITYTEHDG
jgi:hypothetical protein